jgi:16S rRNA (guanine966-N2)-methyltransferase
VFNILMHGLGDFTLEGTDVLDLFAGTGALGLEALSRGARYCLFVDNAAEARGVIRENIEQLGLSGATRIFRRDACDLGPAGKRDRYGLVFADPPYGESRGEEALRSAALGGWLAPGAVAVLEERKGVEIVLSEHFEEFDRRTYGDTQVIFLRYAGGVST